MSENPKSDFEINQVQNEEFKEQNEDFRCKGTQTSGFFSEIIPQVNLTRVNFGGIFEIEA